MLVLLILPTHEVGRDMLVLCVVLSVDMQQQLVLLPPVLIVRFSALSLVVSMVCGSWPFNVCFSRDFRIAHK